MLEQIQRVGPRERVQKLVISPLRGPQDFLMKDAMQSPSAPQQPPERKPVGDIPEFGRKLSLICGSCGKTGKYSVGRVLVDPHRMRGSAKEDKSAFEEAVSFSGIFLCKYCGADGPWKFPLMTSMALLASLAIPSKPGEWGVQYGELQMFDGTVKRTGAASEAYLKQKLEEQPENGYIWGRLGNFYGHAGLMDRAKAAYEKAVELDPHDAESLYNLGDLLRQEGDGKRAAECFQAAVLHARAVPNASQEFKEETGPRLPGKPIRIAPGIRRRNAIIPALRFAESSRARKSSRPGPVESGHSQRRGFCRPDVHLPDGKSAGASSPAPGQRSRNGQSESVPAGFAAERTLSTRGDSRTNTARSQ